MTHLTLQSAVWILALAVMYFIAPCGGLVFPDFATLMTEAGQMFAVTATERAIEGGAP